MTIVKAIQNLVSYLQMKLTEDKYGLQYKSTTEPDEFEVSIPDIYMFTVPSSALIDSYPAKCPCICITLDGRDDYNYNVSLHLCISNVSTSDKEMANPTKVPNVYELGTGEEYSTIADEDLLVEGILFTDQIYNYMMNYSAADISELSVEYPEVDLPDFPYAVSTVSFKMAVNVPNIGARLYDEYY